MPMMNGYETLLQVRLDNSLSSIPIYLLSTYISVNDRELFKKLGVQDCLVKPDTFKEFCTLIKDVLQHHLRQA